MTRSPTATMNWAGAFPRAINGVASRDDLRCRGASEQRDQRAGHIHVSPTMAASGRVLTNVFPNGQTVERGYGSNLEDRDAAAHHASGGCDADFRVPLWPRCFGGPHHHVVTASRRDSRHPFTPSATTPSINCSRPPSPMPETSSTRSLTLTTLRTIVSTEQVGASNYTATYNALESDQHHDRARNHAHQRMGCQGPARGRQRRKSADRVHLRWHGAGW